MSERKRENSEMHAWNQTNIGEKFEGTKMRKELIRATFQQAKEDGVMNKVTGLLLFLLPLTLSFIQLKYSAIVVCCIATFAALQEGHFIRTGREIA